MSETTNDYTQREGSIFPLYISIYVSKKEKESERSLQNRKHLPGCWPFSHIKKEEKNEKKKEAFVFDIYHGVGGGTVVGKSKELRGLPPYSPELKKKRKMSILWSVE